MEATVRDHYVCVAPGVWLMDHPEHCDTHPCEYDKVVLDGQTFSGMAPGRYRLVGYDPESFHPFIAWSRRHGVWLKR
jgi:hypothetical protein